MSFELEICIDRIESARAAAAGGADRLEVCSALELGGLTPSVGLIETVREELALPLHAMIRPRAGGFVYNESERAIMFREIRSVAKLGVAGVVFGALTPEGLVDFELVSELVRAAAGLHCTFHRAIDCVEAPADALERLASLGVGRVLSSGGWSAAIAGADQLANMCRRAPAGLTIMAGAGVHSGNLTELLRRTGVTHVHGSAARGVSAGDKVLPGRVTVADFADGRPSERVTAERVTSESEVRAMRLILDEWPLE